MEDAYRRRRDQLDRCLGLLEAAIERGERVVSAQLARAVEPVVPTVAAGVSLDAAVEHVFRCQETLFMSRPHDDVVPRPRHRPGAPDATGDPLNRDEAVDLTARIKAGLGELPQLLLEAHRRRAWLPLGYRSWEEYVRREFRLSRSRSYELLDQATVNAALRSVCGEPSLPPISALAAIQIKPLLDEVVDEIQEELSTPLGRNEGVESVVMEAVKRARIRARSSRLDRETPVVELDGNARTLTHRERIAQLAAAVSLLASQPAPEAVALSLDAEDVDRLALLPEAAGWLAGLAAALSARSRQQSWFAAAARAPEIHVAAAAAAPIPAGIA